MNDIPPPNATIIPFPRRAAAPEAVALPDQAPEMDNPAERLHRALAALERAVAAQKDAVGAWRGALANLHGNVQALHGSLTAYDSRLGQLRGEVDAVGRNARRLEDWADAALAPRDQPK